MKVLHNICIWLISLTVYTQAEPIIVLGKMVSSLLGKRLETIRVTNEAGDPIVFQIDEKLIDGEYILPLGRESNSAQTNNVLDSLDEIVFLSEDLSNELVSKSNECSFRNCEKLSIKQHNATDNKIVKISSDTTIQLLSRSYINYDHKNEILKTPWYFAKFRKDRFHFIEAGVFDKKVGTYLQLTNELRVELMLKALWGLVPIHYNEENLICVVQRYKVGPIRLIRRGDFHLYLGLGLRGSRAIVNQICYPSMVKVPVHIHIPVKFRSFFSEAYIELTPVIKEVCSDYNFHVPSRGFVHQLKDTSDFLFPINPVNNFMSINNKNSGYGWLLQATIAESHLDGSGFVVRNPSLRKGYADCGYRLSVRNVPKGRYTITNWVFFSRESLSSMSVDQENVAHPASITVLRTKEKFFNSLVP